MSTLETQKTYGIAMTPAPLDAPFLRRMDCSATNTIAAGSVPDLMAKIEEASVRARIREARKGAGLTQPDMAALLNVTTGTIQNYEGARSQGKLPYDRLNEIAERTRRSVGWLLFGDEDEATQLASRLELFEGEIRYVRMLAERFVGREIVEAVQTALQQETPPGDEKDHDATS